jgi:hypothetical protein
MVSTRQLAVKLTAWCLEGSDWNLIFPLAPSESSAFLHDNLDGVTEPDTASLRPSKANPRRRR